MLFNTNTLLRNERICDAQRLRRILENEGVSMRILLVAGKHEWNAVTLAMKREKKSHMLQGKTNILRQTGAIHIRAVGTQILDKYNVWCFLAWNENAAMMLQFTTFISQYRTYIILIIANIVVLMPPKCELSIAQIEYTHFIFSSQFNAWVWCQTDKLSPKRDLLSHHTRL